MQNKLYTIQFSWHPMTDSQSVPEQQSQNPKIVNFGKLPKKTELTEKVQPPGQERIQIHENEKSRKLCAPPPTPIHKLSMPSMVWNISVDQLRLETCSLAEYGELEEVLDFIATTENVSVTNILLIVNPKHSIYWEDN